MLSPSGYLVNRIQQSTVQFSDLVYRGNIHFPVVAYPENHIGPRRALLYCPEILYSQDKPMSESAGTRSASKGCSKGRRECVHVSAAETAA